MKNPIPQRINLTLDNLEISEFIVNAPKTAGMMNIRKEALSLCILQETDVKVNVLNKQGSIDCSFVVRWDDVLKAIDTL